MAIASGFWGRLKGIDTSALAALAESGATEGLMLEFKRFGSDPASGKLDSNLDELAEALCGMANTAGGRLILGAEEKDERLTGFVGVSTPRRRAALQRTQEAAIRVQPPIAFASHWVEAPGGRGWILILDIQRDNAGLRQFEGRYLMRVDSRTNPMPHAMVVAGILAANSAGGTPGRGAPLDIQFPVERNDFGDRPSAWFVGVCVRAAFPLPPLADAGGDLEEVQTAFLSQKLNGALLTKDRVVYQSGRTLVVLEYNGAASRVDMSAMSGTIPLAQVENTVAAGIQMLACLLNDVGYPGSVEVHAKLWGSHLDSLD